MGANSSACSVATSSGYVAAALCGLVQPDRAGEIREEPPPLVALQRVFRRHRGLALDECEHLRPLGGRKLAEQVREPLQQLQRRVRVNGLVVGQLEERHRVDDDRHQDLVQTSPRKSSGKRHSFSLPPVPIRKLSSTRRPPPPSQYAPGSIASTMPSR